MNAIGLYRIDHWIWRKKIPFIPKIIHHCIFLLFNSHIPASCLIGKGTRFVYGAMAVVVHSNAMIGENCIVGTCVTIGGKSGGVPKIGNNVYMATGCKILGGIAIGSNVVIGANAVVVNDIPDNCVAAGVPAKIIRRNIDIKQFCKIEG